LAEPDHGSGGIAGQEQSGQPGQVGQVTDEH
jgi:hypothetical protein